MDLFLLVQLCLISYGVLFILCLLGRYIYPLFMFPIVHPFTIFSELYLKKTTSDSNKARTLFSLSKYFPDLFYWPRTYFVTFVLFPVMISIVVLAFFENHAAQLSFFPLEVTQNYSVLKVSTIFLWIAVYSFMVLPCCSFLASIEPVLAYYDAIAVYNLLPISFHQRLHRQVATYGISCLAIGAALVAAVLLLDNSDLMEGENITLQGNSTFSEDEELLLVSAKYLLVTLLFTPWLFLIHHFKGLRLVLSLCAFDGTPGLNYLAWVLHIAGGLTIVVLLMLMNHLASWLLGCAWVLFWLLPWLGWLCCCKRVHVVKHDKQVKAIKMKTAFEQCGYLWAVKWQLTPETLSDYEVGLKHWFFSMNNLFTSAEVLHVTRRTSEAYVKVEVVGYLITEDIGAFARYLDSYLVLCILIIFFLVPDYVLVALFVGMPLFPFPRRQIAFSCTDGYHQGVLAPSIGRSFAYLYESKSAEKACRTVVFIADEPGLSCLLAYAQDVLARKVLPITKHIIFVWRCDRLLDVLKVEYALKLKKLKDIKQQFEVSFYILFPLISETLKKKLNKDFHSWEVVSTRTPILSEGLSLRFLSELVQKDRSVEQRLDAGEMKETSCQHQSGATKEEGEEKETVALVAIGSSSLAYQVRDLTRNLASGQARLRATAYENVVEQSYVHEPIFLPPQE